MILARAVENVTEDKYVVSPRKVSSVFFTTIKTCPANKHIIKLDAYRLLGINGAKNNLKYSKAALKSVISFEISNANRKLFDSIHFYYRY